MKKLPENRIRLKDSAEFIELQVKLNKVYKPKSKKKDKNKTKTEVKSEKCSLNLTKRATKVEKIFKAHLEECLINFSFQKPLQKNGKFYVVDFLIHCLGGRKIIIELDGNHHHEALHQFKDAERTRWIRDNFGYKVIRYDNKEIYRNLHNIMKQIRNHNPQYIKM